MKNTTTTRRHFLKTSSLAAAAAGAASYLGPVPVLLAATSPNERFLIGCIGVGGMGMGDADEHRNFGDIVAVADVDLRHAEQCKRKLTGGKAEVSQDYRKVLDRKDVDVVSIVTPDHWHVKIAVEALEAGKHVFCQKPLTLTLEEGQLIRNACKKHPDQVFFVGTQQRSSAGLFMRAVNMVQKGLLGDIKKIKVGINGGEVGGPFTKQAPPKELDWNRWLGQAPAVDYIPERCHNNFRWWYEYSGGKFTDWGAHHVDIATWAIQQGEPGMGPIEIDGTDAKHPVPYKDGYPTVDNCYNTSHDFAIKVRYANGIQMTVDSRSENGILFEGSKGRIFVNRGRISGKPIDENWDKDKFTQDDLAKLYKGKPHEGHKNNFYRCIREGGLPVSDVYTHVQAMNTCHLCAIAARLGRVLKWDPKAEKFVGDELAAAFFARKPRAGFEIARL